MGPNVTPTVAKDQEWRQESGYSYPGILAGEEIIVEVIAGSGGHGKLNQGLGGYDAYLTPVIEIQRSQKRRVGGLQGGKEGRQIRRPKPPIVGPF
jgi:hypothetical protein